MQELKSPVRKHLGRHINKHGYTADCTSGIVLNLFQDEIDLNETCFFVDSVTIK